MSRTKLGNTQLLIMMAGKALSIPAVNQASAFRRLVGSPILFVECDHQPMTGILKPISTVGIIRIPATNTAKVSPNASMTLSPNAHRTVTAKMIQEIELEGTSRMESSCIK